MEIEFDSAKDHDNIEKHGVSLSRAAELEILKFIEDARNAYGEVRYRAWGLIDGKPYCLAFTWRDGRLRAISLRRLIGRSLTAMSKKIVIDAENPEWTQADFRKAKPADALPAEIRAFFPKLRGAQKKPKKVPLSIRLSPEVIDHFKATGPGWQGRIDEALKKAVGL